MAHPKLPGIYAIRNVVNGKCYVGSAVNLANRWGVHRVGLSKSRHHCKPLQNAWNKYGEAVFEFITLEVVEHIPDLVSREQYWMDAQGSYNVYPTARSPLGHIKSAETRAKMSASNIGRIISKAQRAAISATLAGRKPSMEARAKASAALRGRRKSEDHKAKIAASHVGRVRSPAARAAMAEAQRRRFSRPEAKEYLRVPLSAESRAKISAAAKRRHSQRMDTMQLTLSLSPVHSTE